MSRRTADGSGKKTDILLEFVKRGGTVKVTAIDALTGVEASIVGPASAPRAALEDAAVRKLAYVMAKGSGAT